MTVEKARGLMSDFAAMAASSIEASENASTEAGSERHAKLAVSQLLYASQWAQIVLALCASGPQPGPP